MAADSLYMVPISVQDQIQEKYEVLSSLLNERARRLWAATEAKALGHGGIAAVSRATGLAESTLRVGLAELDDPTAEADETRVRRPGAGRKPITDTSPGILEALEQRVDPATRGDPMSPLRWTCKSTRTLAKELSARGHAIGERKVSDLLKTLGYSLQSTRKTREGKQHPDRDKQFRYINKKVREFQRRGLPVISIDCKKKEKIGDFATGGREYQRKGLPEKVRVHDFVDKELGKVIPYGVYDLGGNSGWVSVGIDRETAQFAAETLRRWWRHMGRHAYPDATELLITADGGGGNGSRTRLWKVELQRLARKLDLKITVCHFPPGTSKWNKIEHRMWSHVTQNWRGRPLTSREVVVNLIANTTTRKGLKIRAQLDEAEYPDKIKVTDEELAEVNIVRARFHGDWNYTIRPRNGADPKKRARGRKSRNL